MKFVLTLETPAKQRPQSRTEDVTERAALVQALLAIIAKISNAGVLSGDLDHPGIRGNFTYEASNG